MAPIQNKASSSSSSSSSYVHKSSSSHDSTPHRGRDFASDSDWESFLPVTRRGRFFQDSFFENTRSSFDDAVRDALSKWGDDSDFVTDSWHDTTSPRHNNLSRYRQMRSRQVDDDNLAVTVTSDNNIHKIVLDVHDFVEGDLKVKVIGERELLVEGRREKSQQDGASALSTQKFSRRFNLPEETDIAAIDSVMSSDGILTITAPKVGRISGGTPSRSERSSFSSTSKKLQGERENCECNKCNPKLQTREHNYHANTERSQSSASADRERSEHMDSKSESGRRVNSYSQEEKKNSSSAESSSHRLSDKMDVPIRAFFNSRPITRRGRFFDDSFFEDTRGDYRSAIKDILSKWGERSSNMDDMTSYRNMRTRDLREDNQAVRTIEDEFQHKFIVDVQDFMKDGEINVKAVDDRELVVEGNVEKQEGASKSIKKFSRRFLLPSDVHLESVSSVMSSDGVLTIIAPKKSAITQMKETHTQANTQKIENNADIYNKMSECNIQSSVENQAYEKTSTVDDRCNNVEYDKDSMRDSNCVNVAHDISGSSTCSSGLDASSTLEGDTSLHSSVTSKAFQAETSEEMNQRGGHNISIHVDAADDDDAIRDQRRNIREKSYEDNNSELQEAKQKIIEELFSDQRSARARDMEDADMEERSTREKSMTDLDADMRSMRERSNELHDRRAGSARYDREYDFEDEEEEDDDVNFQESSRHAEKKFRSILKTPDRYLEEEDERNSRERSYLDEECVDGERRTPCRDRKRGPSCTPLNPEAKRVLPISIRGHFSSDAFFNDFQENFKIALSDVLLKFNEKSTKTDDITAYRNLRLRDPKLENQAFHVQEDQGAHKVVLDVKDFINGNIEAAVYEENELVVEGRAERRTGSSITTLSFLRRFPLPENVDTDAITAVMSSDGVLTVVTPWKGFSGLSAIKNILSTEDRSIFDRPSSLDRRWDETDWESARDSEEFMNKSLDSRLRSRLRHATDDLF